MSSLTPYAWRRASAGDALSSSPGSRSRRAAALGMRAVAAQCGRRGRAEPASLVDRLRAAVSVEVVTCADRHQELGIPARHAGLKRVGPLRADLDLETEILVPLVVEQDRGKQPVFPEVRSATGHIAEPQPRTDAQIGG